MKANWQECRYYPASQAAWVRFYVTLSPKGDFHFSRRTFERMGEPAAVRIFFDPAQGRFGLKPVAVGARNAFRVCRYGRRGGRRVFAGAVLKECDINLQQTIQFYDVDLDNDGLLILDLRSARVPNRVLNHPTRRRPSSPTTDVELRADQG